MSDLITYAEAARRLGTSVAQIHAEVAAGTLRAKTLEGQRRPKIIAASLDEYLSAPQVEPAPQAEPYSFPRQLPERGYLA